MRLAARIVSQQLDRSKPLWETVAGRGARGRALRADLQDPPRADRRRRGVDLATVMFDLGPVPTEVDHPDEPWRPAPEPTRRRAARAPASRAWRAPALELAAARPARAARPGARAEGAREAAEGLGEVVWAGMNPAPADAAQRRDRAAPPLRRRRAASSTTSRRSRTRSAARSTTSCSTVVSGALRALAAVARRAHRGHGAPRARARSRSAAQDEHGTLGNRIAAMRGPLPVYIDDPVARLRGGQRGDGRAEGVQAGRRRRGAGQRAELRAADDPRPGLAAELLHAAVQPDRDQRAGPAVPALRARARAARRVPDRVPAQGPRPGDRDHVLQRRG